MDASQFTMWLQGFAELNTAPPTPEQWKSIREHLQLVFTKVTPAMEVSAAPATESDAERLRRVFEDAKRGQVAQSFPPRKLPQAYC